MVPKMDELLKSENKHPYVNSKQFYDLVINELLNLNHRKMHATTGIYHQGL